MNKDFKLKDMEEQAEKNGTNLILEINAWIESIKPENQKKAAC